MRKLRFTFGNAKLSKKIAIFSLPAGYACPFANECLSKSDYKSGKLTDGPNCRVRCFAATGEARAPSVRRLRWHNFNLLKECKTVKKMSELIESSFPKEIKYVRINVSGDFFNERYFEAWLSVVRRNPGIIFYGYTKSLIYWIKHRKRIPSNFRLVASKGGKLDYLIKKHKLPYTEIVFSVEEARQKGLEIDHDDKLAIAAKKPFALLLHGGQPKGTQAAKAWYVIMKTVGGYSRERKHSLDNRQEPITI